MKNGILEIFLIRIKKGRSLKITIFKALILLISKQIFHLTYRELANRKDILETNILYLASIILNEPIIFPKKNAKKLSKRYPAWRKLILEFIELGNENGLKKKTIKLRFNSESIFNALKLKFGNILFSKSYKMLFKEILAKVIAHNLFVLASLI
jgi:transposase